MRFADYSPPASPSLDQQRDALRKGLGRAMQWARAETLDADVLLDAALHDRRFDRQIDHTRGEWLWDLIEKAGFGDGYRPAILNALRRLDGKDDAEQLCELGFHYAVQGDDEFKRRLYEIVASKPFADYPWIGECELIDLDGAAGFRFVAERRGERLATDEWDWHDTRLVEEAVERLGAVTVEEVLKGDGSEPLRNFRDGWRRNKPVPAGAKSGAAALDERMRAIPVEQIIEEAESGGRTFGVARGWGMRATPADLECVFDRLRNAREPAVIANYLKVFSNRELPRFDRYLIDLCGHPDKIVVRRAFAALAKNHHPAVREFALATLARRDCSHNAVAVFERNYEPDDERRILDAIGPPDDEVELHWMFMDAIRVLEKNQVSDPSKLAVAAYALTPCGNCRFFAARLLLDHHVAPPWLIPECRDDVESDTRNLADRRPSSNALN